MKKLFFLMSCTLVAACVESPGQNCAPSAGEIRAWSEARAAGTKAAYRDYLNQYPSGCYASRAMRALEGTPHQASVSSVGSGDGSGPGVPGGAY